VEVGLRLRSLAHVPARPDVHAAVEPDRLVSAAPSPS
jgi:hypothetical protein